jgi:hypothetical protein
MDSTNRRIPCILIISLENRRRRNKAHLAGKNAEALMANAGNSLSKRTKYGICFYSL